MRNAVCRVSCLVSVIALGLALAPAALRAEDPAATRQYAAAVALQNRGEYDLAAQEWTKFITTAKTDPRVERAFHYLGICHLKANRLPEAIQCFETVIKTYPKFDLLESTYLYLGVAQFTQAQAGKAEMFDAAASTFDTLLKNYPQGKHLAQAMFYQGDCYYHRGKKQEAATLYAQFVQKFPEERLLADVLYALGVAQEELNQPAEAGKTYDQFLAKFKDHALATEVIMRRGETLFAAGQFEGAAQWLGVAAARPGFAFADHATVRQAAALAQAKKYAEAAALYASLPAKFPQSKHLAASGLAAGKCYYLAGSFAEASTALTKAVAAGGEAAPEAAHWLARSQLKEKKPADALAVLEKIVPAAGASPWAAQLLMDQADAAYEIPERRAAAAGMYAALAAKFPQDPIAPQALYMSAFASLGQSDFATAQKQADAFLAAHANHELAADVLYIKAECNLQSSKFNEAADLIGQLLQKYPQHPDAESWKQRRSASLLAMAQGLNQQKNYDQAKAIVQKLATEMPAAGGLADQVHFRMAETSYGGGDFKTAIAEYQTVIEKFPQSQLVAPAWYGQGWALLSLSDFAGAEKALDTLITKFPDHKLVPRARYARGMARQQLKNYAPAIEDLQAVLTITPPVPERADARYVVGLCQVGLKQLDQAVATFQGLLKDDPAYASTDKVLYELAWALKAQNKDAEAVAAFGQLADKYPNSPLAAESRYHVGESLYKANDFKKAAATYYAAMQKAGNTDLGEKAAHKLAWSYYRQDDLPNAQQTFTYQRTTWPNGTLASDAAFMEGECLFKQNKFPEALAAYQQVKAPSGKDFQVLTALHSAQALGQIKPQDAAAQAKQWQQAADMLAKCVEQAPDTPYLPEILYEQGWAQQNLGKLDAALPLYEQVIAKTNREVAARAQFMIGEIQFQQRKHSEAVTSFFKVSYGYGYPKWQAEATYEAARCFEVLNKKDQAVKQYHEMIEKYPQSDKIEIAKERLKTLGG